MQPVTERLRAATAAAGVALGGAPLGNLYHAVPDAVAVAVIRRAWQHGIRYFDTAPHYGQGLSERRFGAALRAMPRDEFLLSTKVGRLLRADASAPSAQHGYVDVPAFVQEYDYSRDGVLRSLEDSRARLGLARVDIVYAHDLDRATHAERFDAHLRELLDSGLPALAELKRDGVIAGYGIGVNGVPICLDVLRHADLDAILLAGRYTLADQSALPELLPLCLRRGVAVVLGGAFNSGILATGARPADGGPPLFDYEPASAPVIARVAALEAVGTRHDVPLRAAALQFPAAHRAVAAVLAGARSEPEVDALLAMRRFPVPAEYWRELRARGLVAAEAPLPDLHSDS
ncbi:MAG TPA: aldo/keto reductase [Casimicrobiaceae bacterium]|nr:aldo/keto reductase [Casimicrobiaceae bacterium]